jgi:transcriptional regulator of acetoin/glycerol metabolism
MQDLKDELLSSDETTGSEVRDQILASWRRSKFWGVPVDRLEPPYAKELELENRLVAAARPVIDHLEATLAGTSMSIILTNARGQVLQRRTGEKSLKRQLDSIYLAPGFSYAEEHVGTNGIGSAIECRRPFFVQGKEHFADTLGNVSCAGAPIIEPLTGRLQGVIDLTCRAKDANPLMKVLAEEAATEITKGLLELGSTHERALLQEFLIASHASNRAVVAVSRDLFMTNALAAGMLDRADHVLLKDRATELVHAGGSASEILLSNGDTAAFKARPVGGGVGEAGLIVELSVAGTRWVGGGDAGGRSPVTPGGIVGRSGSWGVTQERVERCCRDGSGLVLVGEAGTGKTALVRAAHRRWNGSRPLHVVEAVELGTDAATVDDTLGHLVDGDLGTLVLRHLDAVTDDVWPVIRDWMDHQRDGIGPWITATIRSGDHEHAYAEQVRGLAVIVAVPALRHRIEDVRDLVPDLLRRLAPGRDVRVGSAAMQTLLRHPWPGNVSELEAVLRNALIRRPQGRIIPEDLPEMVHSTSRRALSPWDSMERDLITQALIECKGNKVQAAARLGISRATIYRKLRAYGIVVTDGESEG